MVDLGYAEDSLVHVCACGWGHHNPSVVPMYLAVDNGHVLVGTSTGDFLAFDSLTLRKLCNVKVANHAVTSITIEPAQAVLVGV